MDLLDVACFWACTFSRACCWLVFLDSWHQPNIQPKDGPQLEPIVLIAKGSKELGRLDVGHSIRGCGRILSSDGDHARIEPAR